MKAIFLVINYMPHQLVSINTLIEEQNMEVHVIGFKDNTAPPKTTKNLTTYQLKDFTRSTLLKLIIGLKPEIMVVAGWAVADFVWASKQIKRKLNIPVVSYSDTQWQGTWRQKVNGVISKWHLQKAFSHIWVAGVYQYEYARKLGFSKNQIIHNSLSCDIELFKKCSIDHKYISYPKNFLFIGRFAKAKGLDLLLNAWEQMSDKKGWTLTLIGDGNLKSEFQNKNGVFIKDFMPQNELIKEIEKAGCFILPSVFEPWALVIHEAAAAGLPIIATDICGASPYFIISGFNGYQVVPSSKSIKKAMEKIISMDSQRLLVFSKNSRYLAQSITPRLGAAQLMSVLEK